MHKPIAYVLAALAMTGLAGCDFIRFPGDGGPPPSTPEPGPAIPPGAPGPPPPGAPVENPYGESPDDPTDANETPTETDTPATDPVSGDDTVTPPDTSVEVPTETPLTDTDVTPEIPADTDTDTPPATDTPGTDPEVPGTDSEPPVDTPEDIPTPPEDTAETPTEPATPPVEPVFSYHAPGALLPGSGQGDIDQIVHAPGIVFPVKSAPAYLQSQVFTFGGGIGGGDQCDARNFAYPWRDNFCETRSANRGSPYCPAQKIHQGQDIRVGTPAQCNTMRRTAKADRALQEVVATEDGVISNVGSYSISLRAGGRIYKYLHLNMAKLKVKTGDTVTAGQSLGYVSNDFGGSATTFHLHFEIVQNMAHQGWVYVPPYLSLVEAYERRENGPGEEVEQNVSVATAPFVIPEGYVITE